MNRGYFFRKLFLGAVVAAAGGVMAVSAEPVVTSGIDGADYCDTVAVVDAWEAIDSAVVEEDVKPHWYSIPAAYYEGLSALKIPASAPCNQAPGEKFSSFLKKFNADKTFRLSRCRVSEAEPAEDLIMPYVGVLQTAVKVLDSEGFFPFYGHADGKDEFDQPVELGDWHDIGHDSVIYSAWRKSPDAEADVNSVVILFERIDGQWYFADCYPFGRLEGAILSALENGK